MSIIGKTRTRTPLEAFLTFFGDIKIYPHPMFIVYDPGSYRIKGPDVREILDRLQPGDILLRGYDNYLDGKFIGGTFSHAAFYYGKVTPADCPFEESHHRRERFLTGDQMVVHSMAEGVFMEDILTFTRCDKLAILRLPDPIGKQTAAKIRVTSQQAGSFSTAEEEIYQTLKRGETVRRAAVILEAQKLALQHLGDEYDFGFDFETHKSFSCTEFVYFIYRCVCPFVRIDLVDKTILWVTRRVLRPDDYLKTGLSVAYCKT